MKLSDNIICIFAKPPLPGKTKSRLAAVVGEDFAAEFSQAMLLDIIKEAESVKDTEVAIFYPPQSEYEIFQPIGEYPLFEQVGEGLGERMANAFRFLFSQGVEKAIIIGSDCISIAGNEIEKAFENLNEVEAVLKPANDGGYLLVGLSVFHPEMFNGIQWGSSSVMQETLQILTNDGVKYNLLKEGFDVDRIEDLEKLESFLKENRRENTAKVLNGREKL